MDKVMVPPAALAVPAQTVGDKVSAEDRAAVPGLGLDKVWQGQGNHLYFPLCRHFF